MRGGPCGEGGAAALLVLEHRRFNVDFSVWMIDRLDAEARRVGVTRQSMVKMWIAESIKVEQGRAPGREQVGGR